MTSIKFENNILKLNPDERINYNKDPRFPPDFKHIMIKLNF